jgi:hypothetical protein
MMPSATQYKLAIIGDVSRMSSRQSGKVSGQEDSPVISTDYPSGLHPVTQELADYYQVIAAE